MSEIIISKKEYIQLKNQSNAYKKIATKLFSAVVKNSVEDVIADFKRTKLYTDKFLLDLESGLSKSSYGK